MTRSIILIALASLAFAGCNDQQMQDMGSAQDSVGGESGGDDFEDDGYYLNSDDSFESGGGTGGDGGFDLTDALCGDGEINQGEQCDDGDANTDDGACTSECRIAVCGDGLVYGEAEECDDGDNNVGNDESGGCSEECVLIVE
jgi:cysteine-rich repeat protein